MRRLGSFLPGEGVGGAGVHWNGHTWRWTDMEFTVRSHLRGALRQELSFPPTCRSRTGASPTQELEPYYDKFEYTAGVSGKAGNLSGQMQPGGNAFEAPRDREYPLPPLEPSLREPAVQRRPRAELGYHPFPRPSANASRAYTNPDGATARRLPVLRLLRALRLRGEREGQPAHHRHPDRDAQPELRAAHACVGDEGAAGLERQARRPASPTRTCSTARSSSSRRRSCCSCAYAINNVHLMLLSGIGQPYDPASQKGVVGKNYCYQTGGAA